MVEKGKEHCSEGHEERSSLISPIRDPPNSSQSINEIANSASRNLSFQLTSQDTSTNSFSLTIPPSSENVSFSLQNAVIPPFVLRNRGNPYVFQPNASHIGRVVLSRHTLPNSALPNNQDGNRYVPQHNTSQNRQVFSAEHVIPRNPWLDTQNAQTNRSNYYSLPRSNEITLQQSLLNQFSDSSAHQLLFNRMPQIVRSDSLDNQNVLQRTYSQNTPRSLGNVAAVLPNFCVIAGCNGHTQKPHSQTAPRSLGNVAAVLPNFRTIAGCHSHTQRPHSQNSQISLTNIATSFPDALIADLQTCIIDHVSNNQSSPNISSIEQDPDIAAYHYAPETFNPRQLTLKQACRVMQTFDLNHHSPLIKETFCSFSIRLYGLEDCPLRDLQLAVFLFLEKYFAIQPVIELCVRSIPDTDQNAVGVIFEKSETQMLLTKNSSILKGTNYSVRRNRDPSWIIWTYEYQS